MLQAIKANFPKTRSTFLMLTGYLLLLVAIAVLDQSTKLQSQKNYLLWSHPTEIHQMSTRTESVFALGVPPSGQNDAAPQAEPAKPTANWFELNLTYVRNTGAIWGIMQNLPGRWSNVLFMVIYPIFMLLLAHTFLLSNPGQRLLRVAVICIFAGAIGNFVDRATVGYVIDWIYARWRILGWTYHYPVFNVADIAIVTGVSVWILDSLLDSIFSKRLTKGSASSPA